MLKQIWDPPTSRVPDAVGMEWELRICVYNCFSGDADAAIQETRFNKNHSSGHKAFHSHIKINSAKLFNFTGNTTQRLRSSYLFRSNYLPELVWSSKVAQWNPLSVSYSLIPFLFPFPYLYWQNLESNYSFQNPRRSFLKFCLGPQMSTQKLGLLCAACILGREWWAQTSAPWRAASTLYAVLEQGPCNCSNHSQWKGGMKDTQQFLTCNKFLSPTWQTLWNLLIV